MKTTGHAHSIAGKPVVNATKKIKLHITAADAKKGANKDPAACAAARALMREVPNCVSARVHLGRTYILTKDNKWHRYKTPEALRSEIIAFDRGGSFQPGEYELRPMSPSDLLPKREKNYVSSDTNRTRPHPGKSPRKLLVTRKPPHVVKGVRQHGANR